MIYSCFNEKGGYYEYFKDDRALAVNGDFPVPKLSSLKAGNVGVPARDAARPLPADAKRFGKGWAARGMIVQCNPTQIRGIQGLSGDTDATNLGLRMGVLALGGGLAAYGLFCLFQKWSR